jgi:rod shape determining protein RodA
VSDVDVGYFGQDRTERMQRERVQSRWQQAYAPIKHLDPILVLAALALTGIGLVAIYSAKLQALTGQGLPTTLYVSRQLIALVVGIAAMVVTASVDYRHLRSYAAVIYLGAVALLIAVASPLGTMINGAQSWFVLGGFQFQPSEIAKLAVLVALAALLHETKGEPGFVAVVASLALVGLPMGLVFLQPDFGTAIVFVIMIAAVFLAGGVKVRYLAGLAVAGAAGVLALVSRGVLDEFQINRLTAFARTGDPTLSQTFLFQTEQSVIAIGSGQFAGKGLFEGTQTSLAYVPENHTDFIFTVIGEEFGFLGACLVLGLLLVVIWRGLRIAVVAKDVFGTLLASGIVGMFAVQSFINIGMTVGIMPVTGIPLPFVSYGGTSLIVWFAVVGLLLNVHMRRF